MDVLEAIKTRRSIRHYETTLMPEDDLNTILEAARWAPSWANTQCWRFVVVRGPETKAKLAETLSPNNRASSAIIEAPIVIVACAELKKSGFYHGEPCTDKGDWFMFDVALAMQNMTLAARALGLGTVHVGYFDSKKVAEMLDLPEGVAVVEMTPLGYPAAESKVPPRRELAEIVFHEKYGLI